MNEALTVADIQAVKKKLEEANRTAYEYIIMCPICKAPFTAGEAYGKHFNEVHANG